MVVVCVKDFYDFGVMIELFFVSWVKKFFDFLKFYDVSNFGIFICLWFNKCRILFIVVWLRKGIILKELKY